MTQRYPRPVPAEITLSRRQAQRLRLHAQGLGPLRHSDVVQTVRAAAAIQAQDRLGERLSVGVRSTGLTADDVERARTVERSIVRTWLMRGTLHLTPAEDLRWMLDLLGATMDAKAHKRRQDLGINDDDHHAVLDVLRRELALRGPLTRAEIGEALRLAGLPWQGQATPHLLRTASLLGVICFGPDRNDGRTHVLIDDWLPQSSAPPDPAAELARRYIDAYGPASAPDFRWWSGLPASEARRAMHTIADTLTEVSVEGRAMWMTREAAAQIDDLLAAARDALRVLGPFDPYLLGYARRDLDVPDHLLKRINAGGGMIRACILVNGRLVGTWDRARRAHGWAVNVTAIEPLAAQAQTQLAAEFREISRFLGGEISWSLIQDHASAKCG